MYFGEVFATFLLFLFIGAFFSPLIGGCFGVIIVFTILVGLIVFFSLNFVWFLLAGIVIYASSFVIKLIRWSKLPEVNEYLHAHPNSKLEVGVACHNCGSSNLNNQGLISKTGKLRYYTCSSCGTTMFRFKVL
jgi:hypothetical protein